MLGEGHFAGLNAQSNVEEKNRAVDAAWHRLRKRGFDQMAWAEFHKWRGAAGKANGKSIPQPACANKWEANHVPRIKSKGGGKEGKGKGKKGKGKTT